MNKNKEVEDLINGQLIEWQLAKNNYAGLKQVMTREINFENNFKVKIQFNPERMRSSAAKVDAKSIQERNCFLCQANLPAEQHGIVFLNNYLILVNPFPIFTRHLTIPLKKHTDQLIEGHFEEMLLLAQSLSDYVVFYNGPRCGASAPDHFHYQAGNKGFMPIEDEFETLSKTLLKQTEDGEIYAIDNYLRQTIVITGSDKNIICKWFNQVFEFLKNIIPSDPEPMLNILTSWTENKWQVFIFPRKKHRPEQFFKEGEAQILLSPASVDFGGVLITPRQEDFNKLNEHLIRDIYKQVTIGEVEWELVKEHLHS